MRDTGPGTGRYPRAELGAYRMPATVVAGSRVGAEPALGQRHWQLTLRTDDRAQWSSWRDFLGCAEWSVRVYRAAGRIRRDSVAGTEHAGCRILLELAEELDPAAVHPLS